MWSPEPRNIRIVNWNANSVAKRAKRNELTHFLEREEIDVGIITETRLSRNTSFSLPEHAVVQLDRTDSSGGGVAILIRHNIPYEELPDPETNIIQAKGVIIYTPREAITFFAVYAPKQCRDIYGTSDAFADDLAILTNGRTPFVVAGDLNARHTTWGDWKNNKNGQILANHLKSGKCTIHYPEDPTFAKSGSIIDVFLSDPWTKLGKPVTYDDRMGSDHFPVLCELECTPTRDYHRENLFWPVFTNFDHQISRQEPFIAVEEFVEKVNRRCQEILSLAWFD